MAKDIEIAVIGHLAKDFFHSQDPSGAARVEKFPGGVFYSLATLSALLSPGGKVVPVFGVHEEEYDEITEVIRRFGNVDVRGIFKSKERTNEVHYFKTPEGERKECSKHIASPIPFQRIKPFLDVHGILINMASGFDILIETLDGIRMAVRDDGIPIHLDIHSLTLGVDDEQSRFRRPLSDWRRWCFMIHSIQMTEEEAAGLTTERYDETSLINQLMPLMVNALLITRGERGATMIRQEHKKLFRHNIPGIVAPSVVETVGCGDVFGASFLTEILRSKDLVKAAECAVQASSLKSAFRGPEGLAALRKDPAAEAAVLKAEGQQKQ